MQRHISSFQGQYAADRIARYEREAAEFRLARDCRPPHRRHRLAAPVRALLSPLTRTGSARTLAFSSLTPTTSPKEVTP